MSATSASDPFVLRALRRLTRRDAGAAARQPSLAQRLFLSAALWAAIVLVAIGFTLSSVHRHSVEQAFDGHLDIYLKHLVSDVVDLEDPATGELKKLADAQEFGRLGEPRFEWPLSGWYWQATRVGSNPPDTRASASLFDTNLPSLQGSDGADAAGVIRTAYVTGPDNQRLRQVERTVDLGDSGRYRVAVAADPVEIDLQVRSFDIALAVSFTMLGLGIVVAAVFQVRYGLRPLQRISRQIAGIRAGELERIEGDVPREVLPLAREINALLESNREIVERARTHVGNLAHALKTPLSVITNEAATVEGPLAHKVREQADVMRTQIGHHLERARIAAGVAVVGSVTEVQPVVESLVRTMEKIHRATDFDVEVPEEPIRFRGERQDLEEMVGNLVENACKYGLSSVAVAVVAEGGRDDDDRAWFRVSVTDDGPGLSVEQCREAMRRGKRLDETKPGSGLGLSIVTDLTSLYRGQFNLEPVEEGGLRAELRLPMV